MLKVNVDKILADYNAIVEKQEKKLKEIETEARAYAAKRGFDADKTAETIDTFQALENNGLSDEDGEKLNVLDSYIDEVDEPVAEEEKKADAPTAAPTGTATAPNAVNGVVNRV